MAAVGRWVPTTPSASEHCLRARGVQAASTFGRHAGNDCSAARELRSGVNAAPLPGGNRGQCQAAPDHPCESEMRLNCGIGFAELRVMQALASKCRRGIKPVFAGLMAMLMLVMSLFASSERLHDKFHAGDGRAHQVPCALCTMAQGQLEVAAVAVPQVVAPQSVSWLLPLLQSTPHQDVDFSVASSRGPPAAASSL